MSIFGFLEEMFFCRTEKSGVINIFIVLTENGKENITITFVFFKNFGKMTLEKWTFINVVVVDTDTLTSKNFINFTLKMVRLLFIILLFMQTKKYFNDKKNIKNPLFYTGEDLKPHPVGVLCFKSLPIPLL
jgi:hypothetical protein